MFPLLWARALYAQLCVNVDWICPARSLVRCPPGISIQTDQDKLSAEVKPPSICLCWFLSVWPRSPVDLLQNRVFLLDANISHQFFLDFSPDCSLLCRPECYVWSCKIIKAWEKMRQKQRDREYFYTLNSEIKPSCRFEETAFISFWLSSDHDAPLPLPGHVLHVIIDFKI